MPDLLCRIELDQIQHLVLSNVKEYRFGRPCFFVSSSIGRLPHPIATRAFSKTKLILRQRK